MVPRWKSLWTAPLYQPAFPKVDWREVLLSPVPKKASARYHFNFKSNQSSSLKTVKKWRKPQNNYRFLKSKDQEPREKAKEANKSCLELCKADRDSPPGSLVGAACFFLHHWPDPMAIHPHPLPKSQPCPGECYPLGPPNTRDLLKSWDGPHPATSSTPPPPQDDSMGEGLYQPVPPPAPCSQVWVKKGRPGFLDWKGNVNLSQAMCQKLPGDHFPVSKQGLLGHLSLL